MDKWDIRFIEMAKLVASWSSCLGRQVGAVVVANKRVLTTGYNGASSGVQSCKDKDNCMRREQGIASGTMQEICYATHAEQNAIIQAAKLGVCIDGATMYCTHQPCSICAKMIINSGIKRIIYTQGYPDEFSLKLFEESGVTLIKAN